MKAEEKVVGLKRNRTNQLRSVLLINEIRLEVNAKSKYTIVFRHRDSKVFGNKRKLNCLESAAKYHSCNHVRAMRGLISGNAYYISVQFRNCCISGCCYTK